MKKMHVSIKIKKLLLHLKLFIRNYKFVIWNFVISNFVTSNSVPHPEKKLQNKVIQFLLQSATGGREGLIRVDFQLKSKNRGKTFSDSLFFENTSN
jgi:hypothetical protein